jgi:bifunctional NMN adenylyltransferase/nudix hydrolase
MVRNFLWSGELNRAYQIIPKPVEKWLIKNYIEEAGWKAGPETGYQDRCEEYKFIEDYKKQWANAPFPPTFVTTDAVVVQSGHVLVVRRKFNPGKGLIALPGGFIRGNEKIQSAAIRELKEETGIRVDAEDLVNNIVDNKVFDHPNRSLRGRTVTHAFYIRLKDGKLPHIKANDDAERAFWMPLADVVLLENEFYEDHAQIINCFVSRG